MSSQILVNPYPYGVDVTQNFQTLEGSLILAGAAVATGEPLDWSDLVSGIGYNEINFAGNGVHGNGAALVTDINDASPDASHITCTSAANFAVGQVVKFKGCTSTIGLLMNGKSFIVTASTPGTSFVIASALTGSGSSEVGMAVVDKPVKPLLAANPPALTAVVSAISASGTVLTVTAANTFLPGARVQFAGFASGSLGPLIVAAGPMPVIKSTTTAFTVQMPSALSGSTGTGTATGPNPPQPFSVKFWSALGNGYLYSYNEATGCLFVDQSAGFTPAGTVASTSTAPTITTGSGAVTDVLAVAAGALTQTAGAAGITGVQAPTITSTLTGAAVAAAPLAKLTAAAYPATVLGDCIKYSARFIKS